MSVELIFALAAGIAAVISLYNPVDLFSASLKYVSRSIVNISPLEDVSHKIYPSIV